MAYGGVPTKLPLATFARILGIHPLHFEQVAYTPTDRSSAFCQEALLQYAWQNSDAVGRHEVSQAIADAEDMIENYLRWRLLPVWESDEWRRAPRSNIPELHVRTSRDLRGYSSAVQAKWGYALSGGIETKTLIEAAAPIVWDADKTFATVTVTVVSGTEACEVEAYYPGHEGDAEYQIRPANVEISGLTATITFNRELVVSEDVLEDLNPRPADWTLDADFLDTVDVYRHWNDPSTQATLMWEPLNNCFSCGGSGCASCAYTVQPACLHLRSEPRESVFGYAAGEWVAEDQTFTVMPLFINRGPDIVRLYYRAGHVAPSGCPMVMDPKWARVVAYLAASLLDRPLCSCTEEKLSYWREDLALLSGGEGGQTSTYAYESRKAAGENPFGTRRGGDYAWRRVAQDPNAARVSAGTW